MTNGHTGLPELNTDETNYLNASDAQKPAMLSEMIRKGLEKFLVEETPSISGWWRLYKRMMEAIGVKRGTMEPLFAIPGIPSIVLEKNFGKVYLKNGLPTDDEGNTLDRETISDRLAEILDVREDDYQAMAAAVAFLSLDEPKLVEAYRQVFKGSKGFEEGSKTRKSTAQSRLLDVVAWLSHDVPEETELAPATKARGTRERSAARRLSKRASRGRGRR